VPLTLPQIQAHLEGLAAKIGASPALLPTYGYSDQTGQSHIEVDVHGYHYVVAERGKEYERRSTPDIDELAYWVFADVTFGFASSYEFAHRIEAQDCRRIIFPHQVELLALLSPKWAAREQTEHEEILKKYPFDDLSSIRADLCRELREQGHSDEAAWKMACERYPLPEGSAW
jgi:hypothetical protein